MNQILQIIHSSSAPGEVFNLQTAMISLLLAFVLGQLLAWVYYYTHSGLSYSKSFVQSLILMTVIIAMVMSTIAGSFVTAVGLMGALSIIRFRNMIKDTRDIAFIFCALVIGMACGSMRFELAIMGTIVICLVILYLYYSDFGTHQPHNGFLRFSLDRHIGPEHPVPGILKRFCNHSNLISARHGLWHGGGGIRVSGSGQESDPERVPAFGTGPGRRNPQHQLDDAGTITGGLTE
jgi:hypothetical protein